MKVLGAEELQKFKLIEIDKLKSPDAYEVLMKIKQLGVCVTDLHAYKGNNSLFYLSKNIRS